MHFPVTKSNCKGKSSFRVLANRTLCTHLLRELLGLRFHVLNRASHVECRLRERIVLARDDLLEGADRVLERDELALVTGEDLCDLERLRHETLDLTSTLDLSSFIGQRFRIYPNARVNSQ